MPERVCVDHTKRLPFIRETWAKGLTDYKFFFGKSPCQVESDEIVLNCGDSYYETAFKVQAMCKWALDNNYKSLFKCDDDTYCRPERVFNAGFSDYDFVGRLLPPEPNHPVPYPMGGCGYYLSERMLTLAANDKFPVNNPEGDPLNTYEDGWIGRVALDAGIELKDDFRLRCHRCSWNFTNEWILNSPRQDNDIITCCEFAGEDMYLAEQNFRNS
jgi:hypothetical protein